MTTKVKPLGNRILVKRSKAPSSRGGILLPESAQEKPREGTVIATGPGKTNDEGKLEPLQLKEGDTVLFGAYAGTEVKDPTLSEDEELLIMTETDVLGTLS